MKHLIAWRFAALLISLAVSIPVSIVGVVTDARPAGACSCISSSDAQALARADVVFVGEVVGYEAPARPTSSTSPARWTFKARQIYKGPVARNQVVVSEVSGASCGLEIPQQGEFVVFGMTQASGLSPIPGAGQVYAGLCGGTRLLSEGELPADFARPHALAGRSFPLPSAGWKPGDHAMLALGGGEFHAVLTPDGACAWLGEETTSYVWPAGSRVRFDPTRLIDAKGRVLAKEGDMLSVGGGYAPAPAGTRCVASDAQPWHVQSKPLSR